MRNRFFFALIPVLLFVSLFTASASFAASFAERDEDPMFAIKEGWAWPVVVIQPPEGWDGPAGESVKYAMRAAERAVSRQREGIRGKEVVFLFSSVADSAELVQRIRTWRAMDVRAIVSFASHEIDETLHYLCRDEGPSVVFAAGENLRVMNPTTGVPYRYLFALDLPYYARANALAEAAATEQPPKKVAVVSDMMSARLAAGAELNVDFLRARSLDVLNISVPAFRQDQFVPQIRDMESGGVRIFSVWLDAMATLSIWRTAYINRNGSTVYYAGNQHPILLDAEGLVVVDKDVLLERNEKGKGDIIRVVRDAFNKKTEEPVLSAKAYALAQWVIEAYRDAGVVDEASIADALGRVGEIPLMDEKIAINPSTHRPVTRKYGVLRVGGRQYQSHGSVEIFSAEVKEAIETKD